MRCVLSTSSRFSCESVCNATIPFFLDKSNPACLSVQIHPFSYVYQVIYFLQVSLVKQDLRGEKKKLGATVRVSVGEKAQRERSGEAKSWRVPGGLRVGVPRGTAAVGSSPRRAAPRLPAWPAHAPLPQQPCPPSHYIPRKKKGRMALKPTSAL